MFTGSIFVETTASKMLTKPTFHIIEKNMTAL
jgi:hypothetical protein